MKNSNKKFNVAGDFNPTFFIMKYVKVQVILSIV